MTDKKVQADWFKGWKMVTLEDTFKKDQYIEQRQHVDEPKHLLVKINAVSIFGGSPHGKLYWLDTNDELGTTLYWFKSADLDTIKHHGKSTIYQKIW